MNPHRPSRARLASCLLALLAAPSALAQGKTAVPLAEPGADTEQLTPEEVEFVEEMVMTATRRPEAIATVPGSVTVVTRQQLEDQAQVSGRNLADTLGKVVPGLALGSDSTSTFGQTLRGRNVLVMIDGVPQSSLRNVQHDLRSIDLSAVERVEVVRGTTAMYGEGASGGVINIITRTAGTSGLRFTTDLELNAAATHPGDSVGGTLAQNVEGASGILSYALAGSFQRTGSFFDAEGDRIPADPHGQGGLADMNAFNLFGKVGVKLTPEQRLRLTANHFQGVQDTKFTSDPAVNDAPSLSVKARALPGLQLPDAQGSRNTVLSLLYDHDAVLGSTVRAQLYFRDHFTRFFPFDGRNARLYQNIVQSRLETQKGGGRLEVGTPLPANLSLLWGLDASRERTAQPVSIMDAELFDTSGGLSFRAVGQRDWVPPMDVSTLGLFAQFEWNPVRPLTLRAGVRHERIGLGVDDYTTLVGDAIEGADLSFARTAFNAGAVVNATETLDVFANFSQGFALPDVGLILRNAPAGSSVATLRTAPQSVDFVEAGVRTHWKRVQGSLSVFYTHSDLGTSSGGLDKPVVRAPERVYGMEATLDVQPLERLRLGSTFTWLEGQLYNEETDTYRFLNGYRIPPLKLTGSVEHQTLPRWRNAVQVVFSGHRDRFPGSTAFGERPVSSYFTVDLVSRFDAGPGTVRLGITNLFNQLYFTRESQLLRSGNETYSAARGTAVSLGYSVSY